MKKGDLSTRLGFILGAIVIFIGMVYGQSSIKVGLLTFWDVASVFITVFGSFFSTLIAVPLSTMKQLPSAIKNAFVIKQMPVNDTIKLFVEISQKARREGLLSLEDDLEGIKDEFLKSGLQMVVDGIEPETIRDILELEIDEMETRHQGPITLLRLWSGFAPAYGMIGTLIGLIQMLKNLQDQSSLGPSMAVALITSFYGSVMANFLFSPLATKLEMKSNEEAERKSMMIEGILSVQSGVNPRIVEDKLKAYLPVSERLKLMKSSVNNKTVAGNE